MDISTPEAGLRLVALLAAAEAADPPEPFDPRVSARLRVRRPKPAPKPPNHLRCLALQLLALLAFKNAGVGGAVVEAGGLPLLAGLLQVWRSQPGNMRDTFAAIFDSYASPTAPTTSIALPAGSKLLPCYARCIGQADHLQT